MRWKGIIWDPDENLLESSLIIFREKEVNTEKLLYKQFQLDLQRIKFSVVSNLVLESKTAP